MAAKSSHNTPPAVLRRLQLLSRNLWWSWNPPAQSLFEDLSPQAWSATSHNPVAVLAHLSDEEVLARLGDKRLMEGALSVLGSFDAYMSRKESSFGSRPVAYFCAEFGVHECLPMYSGGLGVLAGDHAKSASDLRLPFVGVGLFYRQGYFQQQVDAAGGQQESYPHTNPELIPVELVRDKFNNPLLNFAEIHSERVYFQAWRINVGHSHIYLLDTDVPQNDEYRRGLAALAYGGDVTIRIRQEIVLGIGGVRLLRSLGIHPAVFHMNEGHAAFLTLELMHERMRAKRTPAEAQQDVRSMCVFTTHTPVPAGHDQFPRGLMEYTMKPYADMLRISLDGLMEYGLAGGEQKEMFSMTVLALRLSRSANGVSMKHGEISRLMWRDLFPGAELGDVPIGSITNGVHVPSWTTKASWEFWERHNSHKWKEHLFDAKFWKHVTNPDVVGDEELWALRYELRRELIEFIRRQAQSRRPAGSNPADEAVLRLLSPDALTIGFARRFAAYKRAPLIFHDMAKSEVLFDDATRPVQIIFAGKAHPRDNEGKEFLRRIVEMTRHPKFYGKVMFLENYDMHVARHLVAGCDLWLNTPRKPLEACGTSGQKVAINGGLHASILDGWWSEAYNGRNGWAVDSGAEAPSPDEQDRIDAERLYGLLNDEIVPLFYDRDRQGIPRKWISRMRSAMQTIIPEYNTHRMVLEYARKCYFPARTRPGARRGYK